MPNIDQGARTWELELAGRVGTAVRNVRKMNNLSAAALSERLTELGYPLTRVAISKIESNTRVGKLDVAELLALAAALGIPAMALLYPDPPDCPVNHLPDWPVSTREAKQGFVGDEPLWPQAQASALVAQLTHLSESFARVDGQLAGRGQASGSAVKEEEVQ